MATKCCSGKVGILTHIDGVVSRVASNGTLWDELQEQGRATVAAFTVLGISYLYTMESWWHAWQLRMPHLLAYAVAGITIVVLLARAVGFREEDQQQGGGNGQGSESGQGSGDGQNSGDRQHSSSTSGGDGLERFGNELYRTVTDASEAIAQSFVAAYLVLFLFGVVTPRDSLATVARLGVFYAVPLGFGAALANKLFEGSGTAQPSRGFVETLGVFALGAIFLTAPIALTQEMELITAYSSWWRLAALLVVTLLVTHLTLFELETKGQKRRVEHRSKALQVGQAFTVYLVAVAVAAAMLLAFGHFDGQPLSVWVQETVVLSFPTSVGASAAQVIL